ncbi:MAG: CRTAC1 family protein, partial [Limisphaerales bacterium]
WLSDLANDGYVLLESEWHHSKFEPAEEGGHRSIFSVGYHLTQGDVWIAAKGQLHVQWKASSDPQAQPRVESIRVSDFGFKQRSGKPAFSEVSLNAGEKERAMPLLVYDLDGDGDSEIVLPHSGTILRNQGGMNFVREKIPQYFPRDVPLADVNAAVDTSMAAVIGDFNQDRRPDLMVAMRKLGVFLYAQNEKGEFENPVRVFEHEEIVKPYVMSAGDFNGDGLLDIWFAQYKEPYRMGQMPDPMFDANDGFPSFLLANRGGNKFEDITEQAGLGGKRNRRTFSGSFWDADDDNDLDLVVVSDFSGVDVFRNDGNEKFTDITGTAVDERANFGMGHTFADFNGDKVMDFYVTGMSSTTARRLEGLGLKRDGFKDVNERRMAMAYGNRMYLGEGKGTFKQPAFKDKVARSGWSWGTTHFDFGNDGNLDLYIANGHRSGKTCKDYCTRFWTHDVYVDKAVPVSKMINVFQSELEDWSETSWNGYEKNHFFINSDKHGFFNGGYPLNVGFEYDSRSVVAEDFDGDGRVDLLLTQDIMAGSELKLHLYRNVWDDNGNWIGVRLRSGAKLSESGTRVVAVTDKREFHDVVVTGDSLACQHSASRHFGLGKIAAVKAIEITWPGGRKTVMEKPAINQWHTVEAPE